MVTRPKPPMAVMACICLMVGSLFAPWVSNEFISVSYASTIWQTFQLLTSGGAEVLGAGAGRAWFNLAVWLVPGATALFAGWTWFAPSAAALRRQCLLVGGAGVGWFVVAPIVTSTPFSSLMTIGGIAYVASAAGLLFCVLRPAAASEMANRVANKVASAGAGATAAPGAQPAAHAAASGPRCHSCGDSLEPGERFCGGCGTPAAAAAPKAHAASFCNGCGSPQTPGEAFCGHCGARYGGGQPNAPRSEAEPARPTVATASSAAPGQAGGGSAARSGAGVTAAILLLTVVAGGGVWYGYKHDWKVGWSPKAASPAGAQATNTQNPNPGMTSGGTDDSNSQAGVGIEGDKPSDGSSTASPMTGGDDGSTAKAEGGDSSSSPGGSSGQTETHTPPPPVLGDSRSVTTTARPSDPHPSAAALRGAAVPNSARSNPRTSASAARPIGGAGDRSENGDQGDIRVLTQPGTDGGSAFTSPPGEGAITGTIRGADGKSETRSFKSEKEMMEYMSREVMKRVDSGELKGQLQAEYAQGLLKAGQREEAIAAAKEAMRLGLKDHPVYKALGLKR